MSLFDDAPVGAATVAPVVVAPVKAEPAKKTSVSLFDDPLGAPVGLAPPGAKVDVAAPPAKQAEQPKKEKVPASGSLFDDPLSATVTLAPMAEEPRKATPTSATARALDKEKEKDPTSLFGADAAKPAKKAASLFDEPTAAEPTGKKVVLFADKSKPTADEERKDQPATSLRKSLGSSSDGSATSATGGIRARQAALNLNISALMPGAAPPPKKQPEPPAAAGLGDDASKSAPAEGEKLVSATKDRPVQTGKRRPSRPAKDKKKETPAAASSSVTVSRLISGWFIWTNPCT